MNSGICSSLRGVYAKLKENVLLPLHASARDMCNQSLNFFSVRIALQTAVSQHVI